MPSFQINQVPLTTKLKKPFKLQKETAYILQISSFIPLTPSYKHILECPPFPVSEIITFSNTMQVSQIFSGVKVKVSSQVKRLNTQWEENIKHCDERGLESGVMHCTEWSAIIIQSNIYT